MSGNLDQLTLIVILWPISPNLSLHYWLRFLVIFTLSLILLLLRLPGPWLTLLFILIVMVSPLSLLIKAMAMVVLFWLVINLWCIVHFMRVPEIGVSNV